MSEYRLEMCDVVKTFPGVKALNHAQLKLKPGTVHALMGENGAGKSTLMKCMFGIYHMDEGKVIYEGQEVQIKGPLDALNRGIAMVHQHFALFDTLTVAENVALGLPPGRSTAEISEEVKTLGEKYGLEVDPAAVVYELSMGERQRVEIIRALMTNPKLLILDEPTSVLVPQAVRKLKADLLHCTSNTAPLWCPVPLVLTLHDIIYLEPRQHRSPSFYQEMGWHYRRLIVPRILKKARKIITVSQFECTRIREALQLPEEVIKAVYNGYSAYFSMQETPDESIVQKYIPHPDFLFFLGNTDPKKNAARTLKAYGLYLKASQTKRPLLIADLKEEYIDQLLQQEGITGIKEHLYYPGYIGNKDLATLYNAAFAFLYPSLRESFGIPILEAMACGTPVVTGNVSAMPEVAGKGAILVNPQEPQKIADALLRLENDATLYQQQVNYSLERVKLFSWRHTAQEYVNIYQSIHD